MTFDPYAAWLDIPADRRPPTYYDLLGISPSESDSVTIEQAALRRLGKVRRFQLGQHGDLSQALATELSRARLVLMDPDRRASYDESLSGSSAVASAPPSPEPVADVPVTFTFNLSNTYPPPSPSPLDSPVLFNLDNAAPSLVSPYIVNSDEELNSIRIRPDRKRQWNVKSKLVSAFFISLHIGLLVIFAPFLIRQFEGQKTSVPVVEPLAHTPVEASHPAADKTAAVIPAKSETPTQLSSETSPAAKADERFDMDTAVTAVESKATVLVPQPDLVAEAESASKTATKSKGRNGRQRISLEEIKEQYTASRAKLNGEMLKRFRDARKAITREFLSNKAARAQWLGVIDKERSAFETQQRIPWPTWMRSTSVAYLQGVSIANRVLGKYYETEMAAKGDDVDGIIQLQGECTKLVAPWVVANWVCLIESDQRRFQFVLYSNGKRGDPTGENSWEFTEQGFTAHSGGVNDRCTLNEFGMEIRGTNQYSVRFSGLLDRK